MRRSTHWSGRPFAAGSGRVRRYLEPLAAALEARPGSENRDLARTASHIATTRV